MPFLKVPSANHDTNFQGHPKEQLLYGFYAEYMHSVHKGEAVSMQSQLDMLQDSNILFPQIKCIRWNTGFKKDCMKEEDRPGEKHRRLLQLAN